MADAAVITYLSVKGVISNYNPWPEWFGAHYQINFYVGCDYGCWHCTAQGRYVTKVSGACDGVGVKENALSLLQKAIGGKRRRGIVLMGLESEPYPAIESRLNLMPEAIQSLRAKGFGLVVVTCSPLALRDLEHLRPREGLAPAMVVFKVATGDDEISSTIEPKAPRASERLAAMQQVARAGIATGVMLAPILPFLTDSVEGARALISEVKTRGGHFFYPTFHTLMSEGQWALFDALSQAWDAALSRKYHESYGDDFCISPLEAASFQREVIAALEAQGLAWRMGSIAGLIK